MAIFSSIHKLVWFDGVVFVKRNLICWQYFLVTCQSQVLTMSFGDLTTLIMYYKLVSSFLQIWSSSFIMLRPLGLFLPTGNLPISFVASLYLFSLQVYNLNFLGSLLSFILRIYVPSNLFCIALITFNMCKLEINDLVCTIYQI